MRKTKNSELGRKTVEEYKQSSKSPIIVILDNIRSLNNIGSFFRTADAFMIEEIILCGITACPPHRDIQKTALGATDSVPWRYVESTESVITELQENKYMVYAIEQADDSVSLEEFEFSSEKIAVVFGNEVKGVKNEVMSLVDGAIEIPQFGTKHSLNVSVSGGIILWDLFKKIM